MDQHAGSDVALVGRAAELATLQRGFDSLSHARGMLALIQGEAGIGKTALALAFGDEARRQGAAFGVGRCYERGVAPAFAPWHDVLTHLQTTAGIDITSLPEPFGNDPPSPSAYALMQSVVALLRSHADKRPVLLFDDLHWADRDTLELLDFATRRLDQIPVLFIATYRSEHVQRDEPLYDFLPQLRRDRPVASIRLNELTPGEIARLIEASSGRCSPELATYLHARSEGNPLFLIELLRDLAERRMLPRDAEGRLSPPDQQVGIPALLQQTIRQRVTRLGAEAETFLQVAAVVGQEWELSVVEAVLDAPEDEGLRALDLGLAAHIVVPAEHGDEVYRFSHGLIRDALYEDQLARRRRRLHGRVGAALEARDGSEQHPLANPAALAYHFGAAHEWRKTIQYATAAGDAARDRYASHTALRHYEQAQAAFRNLSDAHPDTAIELRERLGQAHLVLNQQGQAEIAFRRMLDAARATGSRLAEGQALVWLSLVCMRLNRTRDAHAFGDTALAVAERAGDSRLRALAHWNIGHLHEVVGNLDVAFHHTELAERLARDEGHRDVQGWCLANLAIMAVWRGDYARAESMAAEALDLARADHDAYSICGCAFRRALALGELGRYELARQTVQAGLDSAEESGERRNRMKLLNTMGWIHSELGDVETARHWDEQALAASREGRDERVTEAERYSLLNLATDALQIGDLDAAETRLLEFERSLDDWEYSRFRYENRHQLLRAELALARAEHDDALRWTVAAGALAEAKGMPKNVAKCRMLEGRVSLALGDANQAVDALRQAMSLADRLRHGSLGWQTRYWLGRACASTGSPAEAARLYQEALARVSSLADSLADERLRDCFLSSALVKQVRSAAAAGRASPAKPAYPAGLTEREVDVLRLIADGRPDREIAETLFISPRTVNTHVANILNKLGVSSRSAATAYAVRHGLI